MELMVRGNGEYREDGDQWSGSGIWSSKTDQRAEIRTRNRNVIEMKQGFLEMRMGQGGSEVGVLVWGCTECNIIVVNGGEYLDLLMFY